MTRLICPNCGAQYEVDDDVIPAAGRDVQCSNCGHTWFEKPGSSVADEDPDSASFDEPTVEEDETSRQGQDAGWADPAEAMVPPARGNTSKDVSATVADEDGADDTTPNPELAAPPRMARPAIDASVAEILREEAAREEAARQGRKEPLETQSDLGLPDPAPTPSPEPTERDAESSARIRRLKGTDTVETTATESPASRRELLPDIEEINSTLRSETERDTNGRPAPEDFTSEAEQRRGFRFGFLTVLAVFAVLWALYAFAGDISAAVPSLEPVMTAYVEAVDRARIWVDLQLQNLLSALGDDNAEPATTN
ncbi:MAG: zinc-ribbon domain-containing protein [Paracoccaceae bacterium]